MATAGAVIGLAVDGVLIENVATTAKTLPDFPAMWAELLAGDAAVSGAAVTGGSAGPGAGAGA